MIKQQQAQNNTLNKEIKDCRKEIDGLLDCFIKRIFPLFGDQFEYYKLLTVKLYRLEMQSEIENSSVKVSNWHESYVIANGYKL